VSNQLFSKIGESSVDNLINSTYPPCETTGVMIRGGQGELGRGTVLALSSDDGNMVVLGTEPSKNETLTANCVLTDVVDASDGEAVPAVAYRTGHFNRPALIVADEYEMTRGDEEELRYGGILLSDALA